LRRTVTFRAMCVEDAEAVAMLAKSVDPYAWSVTGFVDALKVGKHVVIAQSEGEILGFYVLSVVLDEAELEDIAVKPEQQGQGIGSDLLNDALKTAKLSAARLVRLEVRVGNARARHLYEKFGFEAGGLRVGYYRNKNGREDALLMTKRMLDSSVS